MLDFFGINLSSVYTDVKEIKQFYSVLYERGYCYNKCSQEKDLNIFCPNLCKLFKDMELRNGKPMKFKDMIQLLTMRWRDTLKKFVNIHYLHEKWAPPDNTYFGKYNKENKSRITSKYIR